MSIIQPLSQEQNAGHVWTNAFGLLGCGALNTTANCWLQLMWPECNMADEIHLKDESITFKELLPTVLTCTVWTEEF